MSTNISAKILVGYDYATAKSVVENYEDLWDFDTLIPYYDAPESEQKYGITITRCGSGSSNEITIDDLKKWIDRAMADLFREFEVKPKIYFGPNIS